MSKNALMKCKTPVLMVRAGVFGGYDNEFEDLTNLPGLTLLIL